MFTPQTKSVSGKKLLSIPINMISPNPNQPRKLFDGEELLGLSDSIRKNGILQPITVRETEDGRYEIIAGERRCRAASLAGLESVPCIVTDADDKHSAVLSLLENLQRSELSFFEEADGIARLINGWGMTQQEAAERLGRSQSAVANKLRLLRLTPAQRRRITALHLTERHARALLRIFDDTLRDRALDEVAEKKLSVTDTERLIDSLLSPAAAEEPAQVQRPPLPARRVPVIRDVRLFLNTLTRAVDMMKQSGLDARASKSETEDYIEYRVTIPKTPSCRSEG